MDVESLTVLDRIDEFLFDEATAEGWVSWRTQFDLILRATGFDRLPNGRKVALLLMKCKGILTVTNALDIDDRTVDYKVLVERLSEYFHPVNARNTFFKRKQQENESFDKFAKELERLSVPCQFRDPKIVRDAFISNMHPTHDAVSAEILTRVDPSLGESLAIANGMVNRVCVSSMGVPSPASFSPSSIRMMSISAGFHDVKVIHQSKESGFLHLCPKSMLSARTDFLNALHDSMQTCKEPELVPKIGGRYGAIINARWYRVNVCSTEMRRARVFTIDFGWERNVPFSILRNLPLDFRVVEPLLWSNIRYKIKPEAMEALTGFVKVRLHRWNEEWEADLIEAINHRRSTSPSRSVSQHSSDHEDRSGPKDRTGGSIGTRTPTNQVQCSDLLENNLENYQATGNGIKNGGNPYNRNNMSKNGYKNTNRARDWAQRQESDFELGQGNDSASSFEQHGSKQVRQGWNAPSDTNQLTEALRNATIDAHPPTNGFSTRQPASFSSEENSVEPVKRESHNLRQPFRADGRKPAFVPRPVEMERAIAEMNGPKVKQTPANCPVPLNRYSTVRVFHKSSEGEIFCVRKERIDELTNMREELSNLQDADVLPVNNPREGDLVLAYDVYPDTARAEIIAVNPKGTRVKLKFIDIGKIRKDNVSDLIEMPVKFQKIAPYAFLIKVTGGVEVNEGDDIEVMPSSRSDDEIWNMVVKDNVQPPKKAPPAAPVKPLVPSAIPSQPPTLKPSSVRTTRTPTSKIMEPLTPSRPPPIPSGGFTPVKVVHKGPEGIFVVDEEELSVVGEIQSTLEKISLTPLRGLPAIGFLYIAPFEDVMYRARVSAVDKAKATCTVTFVDFGNESEISIKDLHQLPQDLNGNICTFKIRLGSLSTTSPEIGSTLEATPIVLEPDGSWLVQLKGEPSCPEHSLPADGEIIEHHKRR